MENENKTPRLYGADGKKHEVSKEIYDDYNKSKRRERYFSDDVKKGRIDVEGKKITFIDSKEDSIQRLMEQGSDFADDNNVEKIICDKAMLHILQMAMAQLDADEQELIDALYYKNRTTREFAKQKQTAQTNIVRWHKNILEKIKKYF